MDLFPSSISVNCKRTTLLLSNSYDFSVVIMGGFSLELETLVIVYLNLQVKVPSVNISIYALKYEPFKTNILYIFY